MQKSVRVYHIDDINKIGDNAIFIDADGCIFQMSIPDIQGQRICLSLDDNRHRTEQIEALSSPFKVIDF